MSHQRLIKWTGVFFFLFQISSSFGLEENPVLSQIKSEISTRYNHARIEFEGPIQWIQLADLKKSKAVSILEDDGKGNLHFKLTGNTGLQEGEGWLKFSAWVPPRVAVRRVRPLERLASDLFANQEVNIASGSAREVRGLILNPQDDLSSLESVQTILEGQTLLKSAVRSMPQIRRGEPVQIYLRTGNLSLSTQGTALEPGYLDKPIRVLTRQTKRELVGKLTQNGVIEVLL